MKNNPEFYKYTSANTCLLILKNLTIRWNSPLCFNDPFDSQLNIHFGDNSYINRVKEHVMQEAGEVFDDLAQKELSELCDKWLDHEKEILAKAHTQWESYARGVRIFCVTEKFDNLLMWAHYTCDHKGVVLKFREIDRGGLQLNNMKKVTYAENIPLASLMMEDFMKFCVQESKIDYYDDVFFETIYTKSIHWNYEQEWRAINFVKSEEDIGKGYKDSNIVPEEIDSIYLGCKMSEADKKEIIALAKGKSKNIRVFESKKHPQRFALEFTPIM
ncbi:MAG: DUF2971 domain-containing protein [Candidatus Aadella gelida]|nr:DUF2971 domain-containing protein [Candidatus Aadella gelida]